MANLLKRLLCAVAALVVAGPALGFSMQGLPGAWMTVRLGYLNRNLEGNSSFNYGPMMIGEEYRMNVPTFYYGFTPAFMNYFGNGGAAEIDKAFRILNELPEASKAKLDSFPLRSARLNHRAAALRMFDIKSVALGMGLEQMGLGDPTRYVFTLRSRWTTSQPDTTNYFVIRRNYDPETWLTTSYINGVLWTYPLVTDRTPAASWVYTEPVDPLANLGYFNAPVASYTTFQTAGTFYTGLTRDDVGGLRYIYRPDNYNIEQLGPGVAGIAGGGGPWGPPAGGTNAVGTNAVGTNVLVNAALRGGRNKIQFKRVNFDGMLGFFTPITNTFTDTYVANGFEGTQSLERPLVTPDILFDAGDVQLGDAEDTIWGWFIENQAWVFGGAATNTTGGAGLHLGPGTIPGGSGGPAFTFTFNTITDILWNTFPFDNQDELTATRSYIWGSFDGTTNAPVVYPIGSDMREVERLVMEQDNRLLWGSP